jgi:hypothetical protein
MGWNWRRRPRTILLGYHELIKSFDGWWLWGDNIVPGGEVSWQETPYAQGPCTESKNTSSKRFSLLSRWNRIRYFKADDQQHSIIITSLHKHLTRDVSNLVPWDSYWVWICTRLGHLTVRFSWLTWTNAHCLIMLCEFTFNLWVGCGVCGRWWTWLHPIFSLFRTPVYW